MSVFDIVVIILYLIGMLYIGFYFEKKASTGIDSYFLGNRSLSWWLLGSSGMASNFDVTGTMINTAFIFAIGAAGFFIEFRGGVTLIMAFLLAFMGKWNRRARVMTIAEWMKFRFGERLDGHLARIIGAISQLVFTVAMVTYFAVGSGKFFAEFFKIPPVLGIDPSMVAAIVIILLTMVYTVSSGLYAVVWSDFIQSIFIFITIFIIAYLVFVRYPLQEKFNVSYPLRPGDYTEQITKSEWPKVANQYPDSLTVVFTRSDNAQGELKTTRQELNDLYLVTLPEQFSIRYSIGKNQFQNREVTRSEWTNMEPGWTLKFPKHAEYSIYNLFGIAILFYLFKVFLEGSGGTGGYMIQRYFAAKSDRDAGLLSAFWVFLLSFRWLFIGSIALMGIHFFNQPDSGLQGMVDPEKVLPIVIHNMIPAGIKGFLIAGMLAAAMSTFSSTINAGATYWVKDIFQTYINPKASEKTMIWHSRISSVLLVVAGLLFAFTIRNINDIWGWITMSIGSGLFIPFLARWYWWRLNGYGFSAGVFCGMIAAVIQKIAFPDIPEYVSFIAVNCITTLVMVIVTLLTPPTEDKVLENFYNVTKPFGIWKQFFRRLHPDTQVELKTEHRYDLITVVIAVVWQVFLFLMWMALILKTWNQFAVSLVFTALSMIGLYFFWFKRLKKE
ncbi:MAG: sodium:solute symporter [Candidatus Delongbacteria bacterium]|nr:sodium:solute symporter [Candidatus Delongbacteria bacterium]